MSDLVKDLRRGEQQGVDGWWSTMADAADRIEALEAENENLEIEVAAAKQFGGGFYGEHVSEDTRDWYRGGARAALKQD